MSLVIAKAGRFELIADCYVPGCENMADTQDNGGPICKHHKQQKRYAEEYSELVYRALYRLHRVVNGRGAMHTVDSANKYAKDEMWKKYGAAWL